MLLALKGVMAAADYALADIVEAFAGRLRCIISSHRRHVTTAG